VLLGCSYQSAHIDLLLSVRCFRSTVIGRLLLVYAGDVIDEVGVLGVLTDEIGDHWAARHYTLAQCAGIVETKLNQLARETLSGIVSVDFGVCKDALVSGIAEDAHAHYGAIVEEFVLVLGISEFDHVINLAPSCAKLLGVCRLRWGPMNSDRPADARPRTIRIAAVVIVDEVGRLLLVRKRGTDRFMQAGGKIDPGETAEEATVRELEEELGAQVDPAGLEYWGRFSAAAANERNHVVDAEAYYLAVSTSTSSSIAAAAEIEEIVWVLPADAVALPLAPLTRDVLLPRLAQESRRR
jgi:8-oxo-dGTP diphosphatase